jgi:translation initiation factor eIF-2B subunit gamma
MAFSKTDGQLLTDGMYNPKEPPPGVDPSAQIGGDVLIGDSSRVGERTTIKRSVVGAHCIIGKHVRVVNSVLMDHVQLADGCVS